MAATEPRGEFAVVASHVDVVYTVLGAQAPRQAGGRRGRGELGRRVAGVLLGRGYRGGAETVTRIHAVKDVTFVARQGEAIGLIGLNGAGKSTLIQALAGLLPLAGGAVYARGEPSLLGVNAALQASLTGEENIVLGGLALGLSKRDITARVAEVAAFAGLGDALYLPMASYSTGMAARLRFAISTAVRPDILLIDEALSAGDADFKARSRDRIEAIVAEAGTVFLVSHSPGAIERMCTRVLWLHDGRLVADGDPAAVCAAYTQFVRQLGLARYEARTKAAPTVTTAPGGG